MKNTPSFLALAALGLAAWGCQKAEAPVGPGIPAVPKFSYDLVVGASNASWFAAPAHTPADSVWLRPTYADGTTQRYRPPLIVRQGRTYFRGFGNGFLTSATVRAADGCSYSSSMLIQLNARDVDTIRTEVYHGCTVQTSGAIRLIKFYYNDRLSASYDLEANPGLTGELYHPHPDSIGVVVPLRKFGRTL